MNMKLFLLVLFYEIILIKTVVEICQFSLSDNSEQLCLKYFKIDAMKN